MSLENRCAIVFGGAGGIGLAVCRSLQANGCQVLVTDVIEESAANEKLNGALNASKYKYKRCDARQMEDIDACFHFVKENFASSCDIVVNCVGIMDECNWRSCLETNLVGAIHLTFSALKNMSKDETKGQGVFIHIASMAAIYGANLCPVYAATKAGMVALTKSYTFPDHFEEHGIRINAVCPSLVDTPLKERTPQMLFPEKSAKLFQEMPSLQPSDVADLILSLIVDNNSNGKVVFIAKEEDKVVTKNVDVVLS